MASRYAFPVAHRDGRVDAQQVYAVHNHLLRMQNVLPPRLSAELARHGDLPFWRDLKTAAGEEA